MSDLDLFMAAMVGHSQPVSCEQAARLVQERYGLEGTIERLTCGATGSGTPHV